MKFKSFFQSQVLNAITVCFCGGTEPQLTGGCAKMGVELLDADLKKSSEHVQTLQSQRVEFNLSDPLSSTGLQAKQVKSKMISVIMTPMKPKPQEK